MGIVGRLSLVIIVVTSVDPCDCDPNKGLYFVRKVLSTVVFFWADSIMGFTMVRSGSDRVFLSE